MVGRISAHLGEQSRGSIMAFAMLLVALLGLLDFISGYESRVGLFYVAPVSLAAWYAGRSFGTIVAIAGGVVSLVANTAAGLIYSHPAITVWNTAAFIGFLIVVVMILIRLRLAHENLESLIQTVAHDLKSPVIAVVGLVRALRGRCSNLPLDERRNSILDQLESSGERMERFLKDLLEDLASDHMSHVPEQVRLDQIVHASIRQHHQTIEEGGIKVEFEIASNLDSVRADPHRIRQVVDNILVNAIRHMGDRPDPMINVSVRNQPGAVLIVISDNGIGIPAEHLGKIFDRFFRVPRPSGQAGTGLGLSIAKKIVDSHGGRIWAESENGRGTTFAFTLPKSKQEKIETSHQNNESRP
ncbi:sensor histidine kinase [Thermodesulfobacteriota bacterium]